MDSSAEGTIRLSAREQRRAMILNEVLAGTLSHEQAALVLGLSVRQLRRLMRTYQARGPAGLVHGNRGRQPWQALPPEVRARVLELGQRKYAGLNQQHLPRSSTTKDCSWVAPPCASCCSMKAYAVPGRAALHRIVGAASGCPKPGCWCRPMAAHTAGSDRSVRRCASSAASTMPRA